MISLTQARYRQECWLVFLRTGVRFYDVGETLLSSTTLIAPYYCVELIRNGMWKVFNRQDWVGRVLKVYTKLKAKAKEPSGQVQKAPGI